MVTVLEKQPLNGCSSSTTTLIPPSHSYHRTENRQQWRTLIGMATSTEQDDYPRVWCRHLNQGTLYLNVT